MKIVRRKRNQNAIDFMVQHYNNPDELINFLDRHGIEYEDFKNKEYFRIEDSDNDVVNQFANENHDVISSFDVEDYLLAGDYNYDYSLDFEIQEIPLYKMDKFFKGREMDLSYTTIYNNEFLNDYNFEALDNTQIIHYNNSYLILKNEQDYNIRVRLYDYNFSERIKDNTKYLVDIGFYTDVTNLEGKKALINNENYYSQDNYQDLYNGHNFFNNISVHTEYDNFLELNFQRSEKYSKVIIQYINIEKII